MLLVIVISPEACIFTKTFSMKRFLSLGLFLFLALSVYADAGFSIRREHAEVVLKFSGINNLQGYKLIQTHVGYYAPQEEKRPYMHIGRIISDEGYTINIQEGGKRWEEGDRNIFISLVDTLTGKTTDSIQLYAKDYSMHFKIAGVKDGKLQYSADSAKAVYQYLLLNEEEDNIAAYRRNRLIFIACSALGFILLAWLFIRRKKTALDQSKTNS